MKRPSIGCKKIFDSANSSNEDSSSHNGWLSSSQAAKYLAITEKALHNLNSLGRVPYWKMGRSNKYLASELDSIIMAEPRGLRNGHQTNRRK